MPCNKHMRKPTNLLIYLKVKITLQHMFQTKWFKNRFTNFGLIVLFYGSFFVYYIVILTSAPG